MRDAPSLEFLGFNAESGEVTVAIDDEHYRIRRLEPSPGRLIARGCAVTKLTGKRAGVTYHAIEWPSGLQSCNCPDANYRRRGCKHLLALREMGGLPQVDATPIPVEVVHVD